MQLREFPLFWKMSWRREVCSTYHLSLPAAQLARGSFEDGVGVPPNKPASGFFSNLLQFGLGLGNLKLLGMRQAKQATGDLRGVSQHFQPPVGRPPTEHRGAGQRASLPGIVFIGVQV
jgi:hypothetical protein